MPCGCFLTALGKKYKQNKRPSAKRKVCLNGTNFIKAFRACCRNNLGRTLYPDHCPFAVGASGGVQGALNMNRRLPRCHFAYSGKKIPISPLHSQPRVAEIISCRHIFRRQQDMNNFTNEKKGASLCPPLSRRNFVATSYRLACAWTSY